MRQALVQVLLARRVMHLDDAQRAWARICDASGSREAFADALTAANAGLADVGLEARSVRDQETGAPLVVLMNTRGDALAEGATPFTSSELAFVRAVVDAASVPDRFSVASLDALALAQPPLTKRAAAELLRHLVQRGWLAERSGRYALAPRALCELDAYLRDHVPECGVCYELVTLGGRCGTDGCSGALHTYCVRDTCAVCGAAWRARPLG